MNFEGNICADSTSGGCSELGLKGLEQVSVGDSLRHLRPLWWTGHRFKSFVWLYVTLSVWLYFNLSVYIYFLSIRLMFRGQ